MFTSLIQEHLFELGSGKFTHGKLRYPALGTDARHRIHSRFQRTTSDAALEAISAEHDAWLENDAVPFSFGVEELYRGSGGTSRVPPPSANMSPEQVTNLLEAEETNIEWDVVWTIREHPLATTSLFHRVTHLAPSSPCSPLVGEFLGACSEDQTVALQLCGRISTSQVVADDAAQEIGRTLRFGEPSAQLRAIRLWVYLLRNTSSEMFLSACSSAMFVTWIEFIITTPGVFEPVRDRVLDVVSFFAFESDDPHPYGTLWRTHKPAIQPPEVGPISVPAFRPI